MPLVVSFLSAATGAFLFPFFAGEGSFLGLGSFLGDGALLGVLFLYILGVLCFASFAGVVDLAATLLLVALTGASGFGLEFTFALEVDLGSTFFVESFFLSVLLEVSAFLASTLACLALSLDGIRYNYIFRKFNQLY